MKRFSVISYLFFLVCAAAVAPLQAERRSKKLLKCILCDTSVIKKKVCSLQPPLECDNTINQTDIDNAIDGILNITRPGVYCIVDDLLLPSTGQIRIMSSDVAIKFNCHKITGGEFGIVVMGAGYQNIHLIGGGSLCDQEKSAIEVRMKANSVHIQDLDILNAGGTTNPFAISFAGGELDSQKVTNCSVHDVRIADSNSGVIAKNTIGLELQNLDIRTLENFYVPDPEKVTTFTAPLSFGDAFGVFVNFSDEVKLDHVDVFGVTAARQAYGIEFCGVTNFSCENSSARNITSIGTDAFDAINPNLNALGTMFGMAFGIHGTSAANGVVSNCIVEGLDSQKGLAQFFGANGIAFVDGFAQDEVIKTVSGLQFVLNGYTFLSGGAAQINICSPTTIKSLRNIIKNCKVSNVRANHVSVGIGIAATKDAVVKDCEVSFVEITQPSGIPAPINVAENVEGAFGIIATRFNVVSAENVTIRDCETSDIIMIDESHFGFGIGALSSDRILIENCTSLDVSSTAGGSNANCFGLQRSVLVAENCNDCSISGCLAKSGFRAGFLVEDSDRGIVKNCFASASGTGFEDALVVTTTTNRFVNNCAGNNGGDGSTNYVNISCDIGNGIVAALSDAQAGNNLDLNLPLVCN